MLKSSAAWVTDRPAVRTAWANAVLSSDTVLVLHGMTDPPKEEPIMTESATHVPAHRATHVPAPFNFARLALWTHQDRQHRQGRQHRHFAQLAVLVRAA